MDGVDTALVSIDKSGTRTLEFTVFPYPGEVSDTLERIVVQQDIVPIVDLSRMHVSLGEIFAQSVNDLLSVAGVDTDQVIAIGSHGQTIFHDPDAEHPNSWQLGSPSVIAARTGISTVADFRNMDIAYGGHGAPLVPPFHLSLLASLEVPSAALNIGGISNLTIPSDSSGAMHGFDSGPGNCLMDLWCQRNLGQPYDRDGHWAAQGRVNEDLLDALLSNEYFDRAPPKSTGRELFSPAYLELAQKQLNGSKVEAADVQATLLMFTVESIAQAFERLDTDVERIYVCGGGSHNKTLTAALKTRLNPIDIATFDALGVNVDAVEATAFAWLAAQRMGNAPVQLATGGTRQSVVLGALYEPTRI